MVYKAPNGRTYQMNIGSRPQVKRGVAYQTSGNLKAGDIIVSKQGRYVSRKKSNWGKEHGKKQLADAGYALFSAGAPGVARKIGKAKRSTRRTRRI